MHAYAHACTHMCTHTPMLSLHHKCLVPFIQIVEKAWFSGPLGEVEGPWVRGIAPSFSGVGGDAAQRTGPGPQRAGGLGGEAVVHV